MMNITEIIKYLQPFEALLKPEILQLEEKGAAELKALIESKVSSPDLQALLVALDGALDVFAKLEINKL